MPAATEPVRYAQTRQYRHDLSFHHALDCAGVFVFELFDDSNDIRNLVVMFLEYMPACSVT